MSQNPEGAAEQSRGLEPGQPVQQNVIIDRVRERWGWGHLSAYTALALPLVAFTTLSGTYGATEFTKLTMEILQDMNSIPTLTQLQLETYSSILSPVGTASGFIGGFVLSKMLYLDLPRLLRG